VLAQSDVGATLRVVVTATNPDGSGTATSAPSGVVIGAGNVVIAAAGDIASCNSSGDEATADLLDAIAPARILLLGDNAYENGTDAEFASCYDPTWGRFREKTHPSPGNHDYNTAGAFGYYNYFGAAAGDPTRGYYAFDLGAWRFHALNSNCGVVSCSAGSQQEQWLRADLATHPRTCLAAFMHHPRFASGPTAARRDNTNVAPLYQAFHEGSGDLWLVGHNHYYERLTRLGPTGAIDLEQGIRNFVVGTGGRGFSAFGEPIMGSEVRSQTFGVLTLTCATEATTGRSCRSRVPRSPIPARIRAVPLRSTRRRRAPRRVSSRRRTGRPVSVSVGRRRRTTSACWLTTCTGTRSFWRAPRVQATPTRRRWPGQPTRTT
jgi:hypothetical protein